LCERALRFLRNTVDARRPLFLHPLFPTPNRMERSFPFLPGTPPEGKRRIIELLSPVQLVESGPLPRRERPIPPFSELIFFAWSTSYGARWRRDISFFSLLFFVPVAPFLFLSLFSSLGLLRAYPLSATARRTSLFFFRDPLVRRARPFFSLL